MQKKYIYLTITLISVILMFVFQSYFLIFLMVALVMGVLTGFEHVKSEKGQKDETVEPEIKEDGKDVDWESEVSSGEAYQYLAQANYRLRVFGKSLTESEVFEIEAMIDDLRNIVLMVEDSSSVLKWKVNQICVDFIPKLINRFNTASNESRVEIMTTTVVDIRNRVSEIENAVATNNQQEFEHYANTLQKIMKA